MEKRKHYFIDKSFQTKFILEFCSVNAVACLLIGVGLYFLNLQTNTVAFENLRVVVKSTADFILPITVQTLIITVVLASLATIVIVLFMSHKISGPLLHMTGEIERMKNGDFSGPVHIRASDQLQEAAKELENLRIKISEDIKRLKDSDARFKIAPAQKEREEITHMITGVLAQYKIE